MKITQLIIILLCPYVCLCRSEEKALKTDMQVKEHFEWVMQEIRNPESKNILVVAHRGDWRNAPENSIQALKNCIEMGVDIMEIDLKMTKDSVLILMHDKTIDRTTSGKGEPKDLFLDSLKQLTLKSAHAGPTRHRIPTFEEFMMVAKGKMFVNIDKGYPYLREVLKVLKKTRTTNQVFMNGEGNLQTNIKDYGILLSKLIFKSVINLDKPNSYEYMLEYQSKLQPTVMEVIFKNDSSYIFQHPGSFKSDKTKLYFNSLWADLCAGHDDDIAVEENNPDATWGWLIEYGANIIQTDRPVQLLEYLKNRRLHP